MVSRHITVLNWGQEQTAGAAIEALRDEAAKFRQCLAGSDVKEVADSVKRWDTLQERILKRFGKPKDMAKQVESITNLRQKPNETVDTFADRVTYCLNTITKKQLEESRANENSLKGYRGMRLKFESMIFLSGLRKDIAFGTNLALTDDMTMDQIHELTRKAEHAASAQKGRVNALVSTEMEKEREKTVRAIDRLEKTMTGQQVAAASRTTGKQKARPKTVRMADRKPMLCYKCKQWGKHMAKECKLSAAEIDALVPMSKDDKPMGDVVDTQFPN
jgi:hypothetical protein